MFWLKLNYNPCKITVSVCVCLSPSFSLSLSLTHSLSHSLARSLTHSLTHALSLIHSLTYSWTHALSLTHSLTHSRTHSLTHLNLVSHLAVSLVNIFALAHARVLSLSVQTFGFTVIAAFKLPHNWVLGTIKDYKSIYNLWYHPMVFDFKLWRLVSLHSVWRLVSFCGA